MAAAVAAIRPKMEKIAFDPDAPTSNITDLDKSHKLDQR